jgi:hypothetical protein
MNALGRDAAGRKADVEASNDRQSVRNPGEWLVIAANR